MASRIVQLLQDRHLKRNMQQQAAEDARQRFGLERQVDAYLDWYHELLRESANDQNLVEETNARVGA
jgi:hypothetical protein